MNQLSLSVVSTPSESGVPYPGLWIAVDGVSLLEAVRAHELPFANAEQHPQNAGAYGWRQFSGEVQQALLGVASDAGEKVMLLQCPCGDPGCWPLLASIQVGNTTVVWRGFEQPHRSVKGSSRPWCYEGFGPFEFDRGGYEAAVNGLV